MSADVIFRFLLGGAIVSFFAVLGDLFRPKSFAGLFGAAPSVALASLALSIAKHGGIYAAMEGRSMMAGAVALGILVEKHERQRKEKQGLDGVRRGKDAASVDAAGAALGSIGLLSFGATVWWLAPLLPAWAMLALATLVWAAISSLAWIARKKW